MDASTSNTQRTYWLKTLYQWHWISSAMCLVGMLLFSITGITLNNAAHIEAKPQVSTRQAEVPASVLSRTVPQDESTQSAPLPPVLQRWLKSELSIDVGQAEADWSPEEIYLSLPRPGGDAWLRIDRATGEAEYERTDRGWVSYFNDLHKGRHTGVAWSWFIDVFAVASLLFSVTGLFILQMHAARRPSTWPLVALGLLLPVLLALLFIH